MADWRQQGTGGDAAGGSAKPGGPRAWQTAPVSTKTRKPWSKQSKLAFAVGGISVLAGFVVVLLLWLRPIKPACLILIGSGYELNLAVPENVCGWNSARELAGIADSSGLVSSMFSRRGAGKLRLAFERPLDAGSKWDKVWAEVPRNFDEKTAIVYLALHGNGDGKSPYFLANDPRGRERITLEKILDDLGHADFADKNLLLIIDASQKDMFWPSGMLHNRFVAELKKMQPRIEKMPNLVVLCASDEDQMSHTSEEWRRTIFLHYVIEGLKGAADTDNSRVTAGELYRYVKERVKTWVQANREATQVPILLGSAERADQIDLVQIEEKYTEAGSGAAPGTSFTPPAELEAAWQEFETLRDAVPSPAVYTPHLWKQYRDSLLRYETLLRLGDPTQKAADLQAKLASLKESMEKATSIDVSAFAMNRTFAMPAALGFEAPWSRTEMHDQFLKLWDVNTAEKRRLAWKDVTAWCQKKADGKDQKTVMHLAQLHLCRELLDELLGRENLTPAELGPTAADRSSESKARALVRLFEEIGGERAAETHYLVMLLEYIDASATPAPADLQRALQVRLLAEEAALGLPKEASKKRTGDGTRGRAAVHPYSERVFPAIQTHIMAGDDLRRQGEDWLFGSDKEAWQKAADSFEQARAKYLQARADAALVRHAFEMRDRVLADIPYYAQWLARQKSAAAFAGAEQEAQALVAQTERLARNAQMLHIRLEGDPWEAKTLDEMVPRDDNNPQRLPMKTLLKNLTDKLDQDFDDPKEGLRAAYARTCAGLSEVHLQPRWHAIENALSVPLLVDTPLRMKLLRTSRDFSSRLNAGSLKAATLSATVDERDILKHIQRQHRLILTLLGPNLIRERPTVAGSDTTSRDSLLRTAADMGTFWQEMPEAVNDKLAASLADADINKAQRDLRDVEYYTRVMWGGQVPFLRRDPFDAETALRRLHTHDMLVWQSRRMLHDHWYAEPDNLQTTFYMPAAESLLKVGRLLATSGPGDEDLNRKRQGVVSEAEAQVKLAGIKIESVTQPYWTSEKQFRTTWNVTAEAGVLRGTPMSWVSLTRPAFEAVDEKAGRKAMLNWLPDSVTLQLKRQVDARQGNATLHTLYRGQHVKSEQNITVHPEPDILVQKVPPPMKAAVAVRMDKDFSYGAVCLMLDTSGSMGLNLRGEKANPAKDKIRFDYARDALRTALKTIPDGTYVSLVAFKVFDGKQTPIHVVQEPRLWKAEFQEEFLYNVDNQRSVVTDARGAGSPIAKALIFAKERGFPRNYDGPRIILALTDGDDRESIQQLDPDRNRAEYNAAVRVLLRGDFQDGGVDLRVVCFNDRDGKEAVNAKDQFRGIEKFTPPGQFEIEPDAVQLAKKLERALRPSLKLYQGGSLAKGFPADGMFASLYKNEIQYRVVDPGQYTAMVHYRTHQQMLLEPGDIVLLTLKRVGNQIYCQRSLYGPESGRELRTLKRGRWSYTVVQNQINQRTGLLQNMVVVEDNENAPNPGDLVRQSQPGFQWMEVAAPGKLKAGQLRWHREFQFPGPTLRLASKSWPYQDGQPVTPTMRIWQSSKTFLEDDQYTSSPLPRYSEKIGKEEIRVGGATFLVESIDVEERPVALVPGGDEKVNKACVVIRLRHEKGKPMWVQLRPGSPARVGEEHHFFNDVGRYTGYFWDLANPQGDQFTMQVVALEAFKRTVEPIEVALPVPTTLPGPTPIRLLYDD